MTALLSFMAFLQKAVPPAVSLFLTGTFLARNGTAHKLFHFFKIDDGILKQRTYLYIITGIYFVLCALCFVLTSTGRVPWFWIGFYLYLSITVALMIYFTILTK